MVVSVSSARVRSASTISVGVRPAGPAHHVSAVEADLRVHPLGSAAPQGAVIEQHGHQPPEDLEGGRGEAHVGNAQVNAVRAASAVGVRTPRLLAGPVELDNRRVALAYEWVSGRSATEVDWPAVGRELTGLAGAAGSDLGVLQWPADMPEGRWADVLGADIGRRFSQWCRHAQTSIDLMTADRSKLVLCHGDVQPANVIVDQNEAPWLIDFEYACLAPREWDPAKIVILHRRFGDPHDLPGVLTSWPSLNQTRLAVCVRVQKTLLVAWLVRMALNQTFGAAAEARWRARSLDEGSRRWRHLR